MVTLVMPEAMRRSRICARIGLPATLSRTFGWLNVCGLSRVPNPATGMIACMTQKYDPYWLNHDFRRFDGGTRWLHDQSQESSESRRIMVRTIYLAASGVALL